MCRLALAAMMVAAWAWHPAQAQTPKKIAVLLPETDIGHSVAVEMRNGAKLDGVGVSYWFSSDVMSQRDSLLTATAAGYNGVVVWPLYPPALARDLVNFKQSGGDVVSIGEAILGFPTFAPDPGTVGKLQADAVLKNVQSNSEVLILSPDFSSPSLDTQIKSAQNILKNNYKVTTETVKFGAMSQSNVRQLLQSHPFASAVIAPWDAIAEEAAAASDQRYVIGAGGARTATAAAPQHKFATIDLGTGRNSLAALLSLKNTITHDSTCTSHCDRPNESMCPPCPSDFSSKLIDR